jgi:hypothetical protein
MTTYLSFTPAPGGFPLVADGHAAPLAISAGDHPGVVRVAGDLQADIERVTGVRPDLVPDRLPERAGVVVLIGTIGRCRLIDDLVAAGRLDVTGVAGEWETWIAQVVPDPAPGVCQAFVIAGSDQRGTIFGAYDVSKEIGVSPWHWWADVPVPHHDTLHVLPGRHRQGPPAVRYRGFFINDENPSLGTWAPGMFGPGHAPGYPAGFNSAFYARVFEVMLRLKANYLWPAVWGRAFAEDDPANHEVATWYGVVMGTSHEAPMMRGIEEWNRHAVDGSDPYGGTGEWSFRRNPGAIEAYWRDGIVRMREQGFEGVVTLGMRGNGDVSLPDGDGIDLMLHIIETQRRILAEEAGRPLSEIPQVFMLYKEVQRYWDRGMRPPDDVTVLFADDNWGNVRKLPDPGEPARAGGYGLYYHYDYVGDGRNYKWVDTVNLVNTWEQLHLTHRYGVDRLWVVNAGDLKGEEMPLQFFLDYAWNPDALPLSRLREWERGYAALNFGPGHADEIARILHEYGVLQARRKPELLNRRITVDGGGGIDYDDEGNPFSLSAYREMDRVTAEWERLAARAERVRAALPPSYLDAYYQLVYYQVKATANLYALRSAEFTSILYAKQGRAATNEMAAAAEARFAEDRAMSEYYDTALAGGKWRGFQSQPKIGYGNVARYGPDAGWQQPQRDNVALPDEIYPAPRRIEVPAGAGMGVAIDGSESWWPAAAEPAVLPWFSPHQRQPAQYIEVFNRGTTPFPYTIHCGVPWLSASPAGGEVGTQVRATLRVDWTRAPRGRTEVPVTVSGPGGAGVVVTAVIDHPDLAPGEVRGFVEANGYVSIAADHYARAVDSGGVSWTLLPDIGRTGNGMTPFPVTAPSRVPGGDGPRLEYLFTLTSPGPVTVTAYLSPRNNVLPTDGLRYAISIDDGEPRIVDITTATGADDTGMNRAWERNTSDNVNRTSTEHPVSGPGVHTLKFWMVDPTVILQHLVVQTGSLPYSYLGPPESRRY